MPAGSFINLLLPYKDEDGRTVPSATQAESILTEVNTLVADGAPGVAITYSANYSQTKTIASTYFAGGWNTGTAGRNQADVMQAMESLLGRSDQQLQGKARILPITTMNGGGVASDLWSDDVHTGIVITDLDRVESYLEGGWSVLGWQNQDTSNDPTHPYAVGGGVAGSLPSTLTKLIQDRLISFSTRYAPG